MNIGRPFGTFVCLLALVACNEKGACVQTVSGGSEQMCIQTTKSVCEQGKGDKWVGGECEGAGFRKKKDGYWEK
jgi:hypothetical protein